MKPHMARVNRHLRVREEGRTHHTKVPLARALSRMGHCSRSQARSLIEKGQVKVDGRMVRDFLFPVDIDRARMSIDGWPVSAALKVYLMLNKPRGLVTTASDEQGRETVYSCLRDPSLPYVSPVGRLDKASEGLLLFTNNHGWAARIMDPATHLDKTYHVQVDRLIDGRLMERLRNGVIHKGTWLHVKSACLLRRGRRNCWLEIVLDEGKNRHIRNMMEALEVHVLRLVRVAIGPLVLGQLGKGEYRHLTAQERNGLAPAEHPGQSPPLM